MGEGESAGSLLLSSMQIHSGNPQRIETLSGARRGP